MNIKLSDRPLSFHLEALETVKNQLAFAEGKFAQLDALYAPIRSKKKPDELSDEERKLRHKRGLWLRTVHNRRKALDLRKSRLPAATVLLIALLMLTFSAYAGEWSEPRPGMTMSQVQAVYGSPNVKTKEDGEARWIYFKWWKGFIPLHVVPSMDIRFNHKNRVSHYNITD